MQVSTKFTIALHVLLAVKYFEKDHKLTSNFLSASIGSNPVIIRNIMSQLREAGIIEIKRGPGGMHITRDLKDISFFDIYKAVETNGQGELFNFHEKPNPNCPVGKRIHPVLDQSLLAVQEKFEEALRDHSLEELYERLD
jgi:transcriptional regulator, badM/rrf2 family